MKWRTGCPGRFYHAGERTVVYFDTRSGDTHLLSDFAAFILGQFKEQPLGLPELAALVSSTIEPDESLDIEATITDVLEELADLDILQRE